MNKLLLCAYQLRKLKPASGYLDLHIVTDYPPRDCYRMLAPWSSWVQVVSCERTRMTPFQPGQVVIAIGDDTKVTKDSFLIGEETQAIKRHCEENGVTCLVPNFYPLGTLDNDFVRESSFFDFELGGKNEWNGEKTKYADGYLTLLSSTHCRDAFPTWAFADVSLSHRPLKTIDIGCGPISRLRWGALQGDLSITGVDPILDMYTLSLARHGLDKLEKIRCDHEISGFAEDLDSIVPESDFDIIYTRNALDHTQDPAKVIECMSRRIARHGVIVVHVAEREGSRQGWDQLHKTDIYLEGGSLMYARQNTRPEALLSEESGLRLERSVSEDDWLCCTLKRVS